MNKGAETTVKALRDQLLAARQGRDLGLLRDVEDGLRQLGMVGYRCCLVDFDRCRMRYYIRLLGYEQARVKAQIEFPIAQDLDAVQWLPLSHLADYDEVENSYSIRHIYEGMAHYIHHKSPPLQRGNGRLALKPAQRKRPAKEAKPPKKSRFWKSIGAIVLLGLGLLFVLRVSNGYF